jgi:hypothetical protein
LWVFIDISGLLCLLSVVLFSPLDISMSIDTDSSREPSLRLAWLFGFFRFQPRKRPRGPQKPDMSSAFRILRVKGMGRGVAKLLRTILRRLEVRDFEAELTIGLDDPADTGMLIGVLTPAGIALSQLTGRPFTIRPSFGGAVFEGRGAITVRVFPVRVLPATVRFLYSMPAFSAVKLMVRSRWKRKSW